MKLIRTSSGFSKKEWKEWDSFLDSTGKPSVYLDSRTIQAGLNVVDRDIQAIYWRNFNGEIVGIAQVEDTYAESINKGQFLKAESSVFKLAQRYLYRGDGKFKFSIRVLGAILTSGDHAYRFDNSLTYFEIESAIQSAIKLPSSNLKRKRPSSTLIKDHYSDIPLGERFAGKSNWNEEWVDLEFDPVMEVDLLPKWTTFKDYTGDLRAKSRTKIKRILNSSQELEKKELSLNEVENLAESLFNLYSQVYGRAGFKLGRLTSEDLIELKRSWGDSFIILGYYFENKLVGFQCGFVTKASTEAFFVGFNVGENKKHSIYQRMLLEFIKQGISEGSQRVVLGRTALDMKSSIGASPKRLSCHMKVDNPIIHTLLKIVARASSPKIPVLKRAWKQS